MRIFLLIWTISIFAKQSFFRNPIKNQKACKRINNMIIEPNSRDCIFLRQQILGLMHLLFAKILSDIATVPLYWLRLTRIQKKRNTFLSDYKMTEICE